jgi:aspartyl-tRNA(Asn)/glutamyl-tRNA(Gln) amidotransferase subunit B
VLAARALGCRVGTRSTMARKSYFYPDLPKGYQVTQHDRPLGTGGTVRFPHSGAPRAVPLTRVHLEEDAGRSLHRAAEGPARSLLDFDRCGTPLLEIVTEPAIGSGREASDLVRHLVDELVSLGVTDGRMERGNVRCDANLSMRRDGVPVGGRSEIKNLNSLRNLRRAIRFEAERLGAVARSGGLAPRETRQFDARSGRTRRMRSKQGTGAYRYFPEPDLPPVQVRRAWLEAGSPPSLLSRALALADDAGLALEPAVAIVGDPVVAAWYVAAVEEAVEPGVVVDWLLGELRGLLRELGRTPAEARLAPEDLAHVLEAVQAGRLSRRSAREVLRRALGDEACVREMISEEVRRRVDDGDRIVALVQEVLAEHPEAVAAYHGGRTRAVGFLMGRLMERGGRGLDPVAARAILEQRLKR